MSSGNIALFPREISGSDNYKFIQCLLNEGSLPAGNFQEVWHLATTGHEHVKSIQRRLRITPPRTHHDSSSNAPPSKVFTDSFPGL